MQRYTFHISTSECSIQSRTGGFISPTFNVATTEYGAKVVEGHCHTDIVDILLNGDVSNYTDSIGYVYHTIGK